MSSEETAFNEIKSRKYEKAGYEIFIHGILFFLIIEYCSVF